MTFQKNYLPCQRCGFPGSGKWHCIWNPIYEGLRRDDMGQYSRKKKCNIRRNRLLNLELYQKWILISLRPAWVCPSQEYSKLAPRSYLFTIGGSLQYRMLILLHPGYVNVLCFVIESVFKSMHVFPSKHPKTLDILQVIPSACNVFP